MLTIPPQIEGSDERAKTRGAVSLGRHGCNFAYRRVDYYSRIGGVSNRDFRASEVTILFPRVRAPGKPCSRLPRRAVC